MLFSDLICIDLHSNYKYHDDVMSIIMLGKGTINIGTESRKVQTNVWFIADMP